MVTSPDQHKPGQRRAAIIGSVLTVIFFGALMTTESTGLTGYLFTIGAAVLIVAIWVGDYALRKNGMRRKD